MIELQPKSILLPSYVCGSFYTTTPKTPKTKKVVRFEVSWAHDFVLDPCLLGEHDAKSGRQ